HCLRSIGPAGFLKMRNKHVGGRSGAGEGFVDGSGARIYYKTLGLGVPLLLLHGGPGADHSDFLPALQPLARHCQLVLIDERGSGRSERLKDPKGYTLSRMLAQAYAVRHPKRILGLVLAGTGSTARCIDRDFRNLRKRLPERLRARL